MAVQKRVTLFYVFLTFLVTGGISPVLGLECYVCNEQEDNDGKCASTVMTCDYLQDRCLSIIKWGSTPYWEIGAPMQYYISKKCANEAACNEMSNRTIGLCQRIEWRDWECSECCQGDRCNYYITLGSSSVKSSLLVLSLSGFLLWILNGVSEN